MAVMFLGVPLFVALIVVLGFSALLGLGAEAVLHRPMRERDATSSIIASFGLAVALQNAALLAFGPQPILLRTELANISVELGPVFLPFQRVLIPIVMAVLIGLLYVVLRYTWIGWSLRAMSQHPTVARLCGVRTSRVAIVTFMAGSALAGVAGFLMSSVFMVHPLIGSMIVLKAFTVVILGGMGSVTGAALAGLLLGITESMTSGYLANGLRDIVGFVFVIAALLFRPQGLFGRAIERS
jgi:branched-chain amino acid transport system permease protein